MKTFSVTRYGENIIIKLSSQGLYRAKSANDIRDVLVNSAEKPIYVRGHANSEIWKPVKLPRVQHTLAAFLRLVEG